MYLVIREYKNDLVQFCNICGKVTFYDMQAIITPFVKKVLPCLYYHALLKDRNITKLQELVNKELKIVDEWMKYNRLSLNYNKTTFFVVYPKRQKNNTNNFSLTVGGHDIPFSNYTKYLGIIIDEELSWRKHYNYIANKLSKAAGILCRIRHYINKKTLINLYFCISIP